MAEKGSVEQFRLFVAIPVPAAVREEILRVQRQLQPLAPRGAVRWTKPEQFHLTLRFLGGVSSDHVAGLQESLRTACSGAAPLYLHAQGVGFFPNARAPRVIWIGIHDGVGKLEDLQGKIEAAVQPFITERESERFAGHVTLGRFKQFGHWHLKALTGQAAAMNDRMFGGWPAPEIGLIRSELSPTGARHTRLATIPLGTKIASL
ncbi:MAG TPA: RNA 2',3'-cyclic phosphodiesterase [Candidatus Sulfopaludibacter sp.]|nr:RNA 2',3'-cyclic phosphodiesterase [Candidatus Sulfopaludibacter sp.]